MAPALLVCLVIVAGLGGLFAGSLINSVVDRFPDDRAPRGAGVCPHCRARVPWGHRVPVLSWLALRGTRPCCGASIPARHPLVEAATGCAFAGVTAGLLTADTPPPIWLASVTPAYLYFAALGIALTLIDLRTHRLPNALVLPGYPVAAVLLVTACLLGAEWAGLVRAAIGMVALFSFYFALRLIGPTGMGGGDVKLAGLVGWYLGWLGWSTLVVGAAAAFVLGGVFGVILLALRRAGRRAAIPFGPWMILGAWVGIVFGEALVRFALS